MTEGLNINGETWRALAAEVTRIEVEKLRYKAAYENLVGLDAEAVAIRVHPKTVGDGLPARHKTGKMPVPHEVSGRTLRKELE